MEVYIGNERVYPHNGISINETLDETLDSGSFVLPFTYKKEVYKPCTPVRIITDNKEELNFIISSDIVELVKKGYSTLYQHNITIVQNSRIMSKKLMRNSCFYQPKDKYLKVDYNSLYRNFKDDGEIKYPNLVLFQSFMPPKYKQEKTKYKNGFLIFNCKQMEQGLGSTVSIDNLPNLPKIDIVFDLGTNKKTKTIKDVKNGVKYFLTDEELSFFSLAKDGTKIGFDITSNAIQKIYEDKNIIIQVNFSLYLEQYYYTMYDILDLIKKRYNGDCGFKLPTSGEFYDKLKSTIAPNFTFTQTTVYEAVNSVLSYFDGISKLDSNGVLGIEYYNKIEDKTLEPIRTTSDTKFSISEEKYINNLITYYQNAEPENFITQELRPSQNDTYGVPTADEYYIATDFPIRYIEKIEMLVGKKINLEFLNKIFDNYGITSIIEDYMLVDITDYVVEKKIWDNLLDPNADFVSDNDRTAICKRNTFFYSQGSNKINISNKINRPESIKYAYNNVCESALRKLFAVPQSKYSLSFTHPISTEHKDIKFRITYKPILNGRLLANNNTNKYQGETMITQNDGGIDLRKLGINMNGIANRIGVPDLYVSQKFSKFDDRIKKGTVWDIDNKMWFANNVSTTIFNDFVVCEVTFSQNFNRLSQYIKLNQVKRFNEISSEIISDSEENIMEYLYVSALKPTITFEEISIIPRYWKNKIKESFTNLYTRMINFCWFKALNVITGKKSLCMPISVYSSGNSICHECSYNDPILAYSQIDGDKNLAITYTEDTGFLDSISINLCSLIDDSDKNLAEDFPFVTQRVRNNLDTLATIDKNLYKQPNEIMKLNYQLSILPRYENMEIISKEFMRHNAFVGISTDKRENLKFYYSRTGFYSISDTKAKGQYYSVAKLLLLDNDANSLKGVIVNKSNNLPITLPSEISSWCIADEEDNILLAFNCENTEFYMFTRKNIL